MENSEKNAKKTNKTKKPANKQNIVLYIFAGITCVMALTAIILASIAIAYYGGFNGRL
ncbi:MAG: hypothetical protein FWD49_02830 [Firmicutes bacterium]|nr:hypothetical protein [Bacillota bacterium]